MSKKLKCICGHEGNDFIVLKAVTWRVSKSSYSSDWHFPDQGVNLMVCPECGTVRCNIRKENEYKYVKRANFIDSKNEPPFRSGWRRSENTMS
jgi:hypothetical protein